MNGVLRWLPRVLAATALGLFVAFLGVESLLLVGVWIVLIGAFRLVTLGAASRMAKVSVDATFLVLLGVAVFEGGWWLIPAGLAWLVGDLLLTSPEATA